MATQLVTGETGSGKTNYLYDEIITKSKELKDDRSHQSKGKILLIVPEQSTLDVQHRMIEKHPNHCITDIEVLSFGRLAYRMTDELGIAGKTVIDDVGKNMMISRIIQEQSKDFPFLSKHIHKKGYINELRNLMSEFNRYALEDDALSMLIENIDDPLLKLKLRDCHSLYNRYSLAIEVSHFSGDTLINLLVEQIPYSDFISESTVYIDGFYGYTPIQYALIERLMAKVKKLTISITVDNDLLKEAAVDKAHLYYESHDTYKKMMTMVWRYPDIEFIHRKMQGALGHECQEHLKKYMFRYPYKQLEKETEHIEIFRASSMEKEVAYLRDQLLELVMEKGYRYKDVAILMGDVGRYERVINAQFAQVGIPYYLDRKKTMLSNDAAVYILNLIRIMQYDFSYNYMFAYLKSGYVPCDETALDYMENYVLRYGIRGHKRWTTPWIFKLPNVYTQPDAPIAKTLLELLNETKTDILEPLLSYRDKKPKSVKQHVTALYTFMVATDFEKKIEEKSNKYEAMGQLNLYREYKQVYRLIVDILDQLYEISGEHQADYGEFASLLEAGFEQMELGNVPARLDEVLIGDLTRTRLSDRKAVFILGVNEGLVPKLKEGTSLLTDRERDLIETKGITLAPSALRSIFREQFYIFLKMFTATEKLSLSYTMVDDTGQTTRAAHLIHMVKKLLPKINVVDVDSLYESNFVINQPEVVYHKTIKALQKRQDKEFYPILEWYRSDEFYGERLNKAFEGRDHHLRREHLSKASVDRMYGDNLLNTVTRLEAFSRCPFAHFSTYGLKATEREQYEITMPQLGMVFHRVIELFVKRVIDRELLWHNIDDKIRAQWIEELVDVTLANEAYTVFFDSKRNRFMVKRLKTILGQALKVIGHQISQGSFAPVSAEWQFRGDDHQVKSLNLPLEDKKTMRLLGTIDRVDMYDTGAIKYMTVIDYKSSSKDIDFEDVYHGLQLQLFVYLNAAIELTEMTEKKAVKPAGVFYFKIDDPFIDGDEHTTSEQVEADILKRSRLKGLVLEDEEVIRHLDHHLTSESSVIHVKLNKDGGFSKLSKTIDEEKFEIVRKYVKNKTKELGNAIIGGIIEAKPYKKKQQTACDYCAYKGLCGFDNKLPGYDYRPIDNGVDDYIALMNQKKEG